MTNSLKHHDIAFGGARTFSTAGQDILGMVDFISPDTFGDEVDSALAYPADWGAVAGDAMGAGAYDKVPADLVRVEENAMPSWLWKHKSSGASTYQAENSIAQIFARIAGSACYRGWQAGFFADEGQARCFYDETLALLIKRVVVLNPASIKNLGIDWAYGGAVGDKKSTPLFTNKIIQDTPDHFHLRNASIDAIIGGRDHIATQKWHSIIGGRKAGERLNLRFIDTVQEWGTGADIPALATINLLHFLRTDDGMTSFQCEALTGCIETLSLLLHLHDLEGGISFCNLAPSIMAWGVAYDSDEGRALAAAISSLFTAEAMIGSAKIAGRVGISPLYLRHHDMTLRNLRNRHRATFGDKNDYEKMSVTPSPLALAHCPDLALISAARYRWQCALDMAQADGLRAIEPTTMFTSADMGLIADAMGQGIDPMPNLVTMVTTEDGSYKKLMHPGVTMGLQKLGYSAAQCSKAREYLVGHGTLKNGNGITHKMLRDKGFDKNALDRIEAYLSQVNDLRLAITPWVVGIDFCVQKLGVTERVARGAGFDLLRHLKIPANAVKDANIYCYGHGNLDGFDFKDSAHARVFVGGTKLSPLAQVRMASAVQSFVTGDVNLHLSIPAGLNEKMYETILLDAWRMGVKGISVYFETNMADFVVEQKHTTPIGLDARGDAVVAAGGDARGDAGGAGRKKLATLLHILKPRTTIPPRKSKAKAGTRMMGIGAKGKSGAWAGR